MFRLVQRRCHPNYSNDEFNYAFDIWHDGYQARRAEKAAVLARMPEPLKERDKLSDRPPHLSPAESTGGRR